jgi:hypothetical protein
MSRSDSKWPKRSKIPISASSFQGQYVAPRDCYFLVSSQQQQTREDVLRKIPAFWTDPTLVLTANRLLTIPGWSSFKWIPWVRRLDDDSDVHRPTFKSQLKSITPMHQHLTTFLFVFLYLFLSSSVHNPWPICVCICSY